MGPRSSGDRPVAGGRASGARSRRALDAALLLCLAAIAVSAAVLGGAAGGEGEGARQDPVERDAAPPPVPTDPVGPDGGGPDRLLAVRGPLREEGGLLWWVDARCRAASADLSSGEVVRIAGEHCSVWPAPAGGRAAALQPGDPEADGGPRLLLLADRGRAELRGFPEPGAPDAGVAWRLDGAALAACVARPAGTAVEVAVEGAGSVVTVEDACFPAWLPDGRLAVGRREPARVELDGRRVIGAALVERLLPSAPGVGSRVVTGLGAGAGGLLAAGLVAAPSRRDAPQAAAVAVAAHDGSVVYTAFLSPGSIPTALALAPDGSGLSYRDAASGTAIVREIPGGRRFPVFGATAVAWSPSGRHLAAATPDGVQVVTWPEGEPVEVLPIDGALALAWTGS